MNATSRSGKTPLFFLVCLSAILSPGHVAALLPASPPIITSLALVGTNLVFNASFPAGVERAILELRPTLAADWQEASRLQVPTNGGNLEFSIPQPALDTAFFRLHATFRSAAQAELSTEVRLP